MHLGRWIFAAAALTSALVFVRCGGGKDCASSADCSSAQACVFDEHAGCGAKGTCASITDNCDSTFARRVCGCHGDIAVEAKCTDVAGFLAPVTSDPHCFDPDSGILDPDASDEGLVIAHDAAVDARVYFDSSVAGDAAMRDAMHD